MRPILLAMHNSKCEHCGCDDESLLDSASVGHIYTENPEDWKLLCGKCHIRFDGRILLGESNPSWGRKASKETIELLRLSHIGKPGYWRGKKRSDESKKKISVNRKGKHTGEQHYLYGKSLLDDTKKKISDANMGKKRAEWDNNTICVDCNKPTVLHKNKFGVMKPVWHRSPNGYVCRNCHRSKTEYLRRAIFNTLRHGEFIPRRVHGVGFFRICIGCGRGFFTDYKDKKYCSIPCGHVAKSRLRSMCFKITDETRKKISEWHTGFKHSEKSIKKMKLTKLNQSKSKYFDCATCGGEVYVQASQFHIKKHYCNKQCYNNRRTGKIISCAYCKKKIYKMPAEITRAINTNQKMYCNKVCSDKGQYGNNRAKNLA